MVAHVESDRAFSRLHHAEEAAHSGGSLLAHLSSTAELLARWDAPPHVCRAGLYHRVYGTGAFADALTSQAERARVAAQIGQAAETLVYLFSSVTRDSLHANAGRDRDFWATCRHTGARLPLAAETLGELLLLSAASWAEQLPRLSAELGCARAAEVRRMLPHLPAGPRAALRRALAQALDADPQADPVPLAELLSFDSPQLIDQSCAALDARYLGLISAHLRARTEPGQLARLDALGDDAYLAILRSPATCARLLGPAAAAPRAAAELAHFLEGALQIEEWRAGSRARIERDAWSADAELFLPAGTQEGPQQLLYELAHAPRAFAPGRPYLAPRIGGWVVADLHGPEVHRPLPQSTSKHVPYGPAEPMTEDEQGTVLDKLERAFAGIGWVSPAATRFLRYTLATIIPRKQTQPHLYPRSFKGSSTAATIHRANLYNLHLRNVDAARLAQSILHETVHNHLYKRELFTPTLLDDQAGESLRVKSPWSGNPLDLHVFAHSSTVYYAVHSFFSRAGSCPDLPRDTVTWFRDRAVQGFASPAWQAIIDTHHDLFAPAMRRDLFAMRARVLADTAARALRSRQVAS